MSMDPDLWPVIFTAMLLAWALTGAQKPFDEKKELTAMAVVLGVLGLCSGWLHYDQDRPYTGLAAVVYSEATLSKRKEAEREVNEYVALSEAIRQVYVR